jgi:hypothetical protein
MTILSHLLVAGLTVHDVFESPVPIVSGLESQCSLHTCDEYK